MNPSKKIQNSFLSSSSSHVDLSLNEEDLSTKGDEFSSGSSKKQRKRRTLSETSKRDFVCGCGKSYVSYPAIYLHVQRKHNGEWPEGTAIPEKPETQDKVKRGRPKSKLKKEKNNMLDVYNDLEAELKYKVEDNFWLFVGLKGNSENQKLENKFILNQEAGSYDLLKVFHPKEIFHDKLVFDQILENLHRITTNLPSIEVSQQTCPITQCDDIFSEFINWISATLKEDIFIELSIIILFLRIIIYSCIWYDKRKQKVFLKDDILNIQLNEKNVQIKLSQGEISNIKSFCEHNVCPLLGSKWGEIKKNFDGEVIKEILADINKDGHDINEEFNKKLEIFSNTNGGPLNKLCEATLYMRETELKESIKTSQAFNFLSWRTNDDLKELLQKMCDWLKVFDADELKLKKIELNH